MFQKNKKFPALRNRYHKRTFIINPSWNLLKKLKSLFPSAEMPKLYRKYEIRKCLTTQQTAWYAIPIEFLQKKRLSTRFRNKFIQKYF